MKDNNKKINNFSKEFENFEEWENSIDGVMYNLQTVGDITMQDEKDKFLVAKTLLKLPEKIRKKVLNEVIFVIMRVAGTVVELFTNMDKQTLILLNFSEIEKGREVDTIAHEIAHFILRHHKINRISEKKNEREADNLTEKWGFRKAYKNYDIFEVKNPPPKNHAKIKQKKAK